MKIASWNVNSLNVRLPHLQRWLDEAKPDVVALQETKQEDHKFPEDALLELGYRSVFSGQKTYNGVAIISRLPFTGECVNAIPGFDDPQKRVLAATVGDARIVDLYVLNGEAVGSGKFDYKLRWMAQLRAHVAALSSPDEQVVVTGDFNIAPTDLDVYDPKKLVGATHVSEPERAELAALEAWGFTDLFRQHHPEGKLFSWWDYRAGDFHQGRGMRIDLVLGTASVAARCDFAIVDRNARKGTSPSDHAPVIVDLA